jgi:hypothetical protein
MMTERYIPSGRTSLVKTGTGSLQLQTEYAYHPYPRITTTIQSSGQVLHKVEKRLEKEIGSIEEQQRMENIMKRQHAEVETIVRRQPGPQQTKASDQPEAGPASETPDSVQTPKSIKELLREVPGVEHIYRLDNSGVFHSEAVSKQFKKSFAPVFKGLHELLLLFDELPGPGPRRRRGIYEVQRDRLYLISVGNECLFVTVNRVDRETDYEQALKETAFGKWGPDFAYDGHAV